jgi:hypothetical protein
MEHLYDNHALMCHIYHTALFGMKDGFINRVDKGSMYTVEH